MTDTSITPPAGEQGSINSLERTPTVAFSPEFGARVQYEEGIDEGNARGEVILDAKDALDAARYIIQELGMAKGYRTANPASTKNETGPFSLKIALSNLAEHSRREAAALGTSDDAMPWLDEARDALAFADGLSVTHIRSPDGTIIERMYGLVDRPMEEHLRGVCNACCPICLAVKKERLKAAAPKLLEAALDALPYVEDVLSNPEQLAGFKKGVVQNHAKAIRAAIADAAGEEALALKGE